MGVTVGIMALTVGIMAVTVDVVGVSVGDIPVANGVTVADGAITVGAVIVALLASAALKLLGSLLGVRDTAAVNWKRNRNATVREWHARVQSSVRDTGRTTLAYVGSDGKAWDAAGNLLWFVGEAVV